MMRRTEAIPGAWSTAIFAMVSLVPVFALQYRPDLQRLPQLIEIIQDAAGSSNAKSSTFRLRDLVP